MLVNVNSVEVKVVLARECLERVSEPAAAPPAVCAWSWRLRGPAREEILDT